MPAYVSCGLQSTSFSACGKLYLYKNRDIFRRRSNVEKLILDGFYEEGYHYYVEIKGSELIVRDYARRIMLTTVFTWDDVTLQKEGKVILQLADNVLSRDAENEPFTWIKALVYDHDRLEMDYYYVIMGDTHYTLNRVDHGPFDHLNILDDEWLPKLQGKWVNGLDREDVMTIRDNQLKICLNGYMMLDADIHVVSEKTYPDSIRLTPADLTRSDFGSYTAFTVEDDMLTGYMIIMDASSPLLAYIREEDFGKIDLPSAVHDPVRNTMMHQPDIRPMFPDLSTLPGAPGMGPFFPPDGPDDIFPTNGADGRREAAEAPEAPEGTWTCPLCNTTGLTGKFCSECGSPRPF